LGNTNRSSFGGPEFVFAFPPIHIDNRWLLRKSDGVALGVVDSIDVRKFIFEVIVINWSEIPDLAAIALLTAAFASVSRRNPTPVSGIWLTGWMMIALHFGAFLFLLMPGPWGQLAGIVGLSALVWAGLLFMWSSVPYRQEISSRWMFGVLGATNTLYIALLSVSPSADRALIPAATLIGALPLLVTLLAIRRFNSRLRWVLVTLYSILATFLLLTQFKSGDGGSLALNGVLFTVYFGCCIHFWYAHRRATAGSFITVSGFVTWASVFVVAPWMQACLPAVHVESEVWNLPKFVVAVGMILLLLEDQIEHNRHLALHDHLTGLPNRRLYQDRLAIALERARRSEAQAALLVVDLDRFKQVNDTLGHHVGDLVLQYVAAMFSGRVRRSDTVARTGGDEFSIILEGPTSREDAFQVGETLKLILEEPMHLAGKEVRVGASIGIAVFPDDANQMEDLCIAADLRMYDAKNSSAILSKELAPVRPYLLTALK
jgi:diguanylate cyclase (GGDEF)-like protein